MKRTLTVLGVMIFLASVIGGIIYYVSSDDDSTTAVLPKLPIVTELGDTTPLRTLYFTLRANALDTTQRLPDSKTIFCKDNKYVVVDLSYTNTYAESHTLLRGNLLINCNGKTCRYDSDLDYNKADWDLLSQPINPGISCSVKIGFIIPKTLHGEAYYQPAGNINVAKIHLGKV